MFAIVWKKEVIGFIDLDKGSPAVPHPYHRYGLEDLDDERDAAIGYQLCRKVWGQGIATKTVERTIDFAFGIGGIKRLVAEVLETNIGSRRVLEKNGFIEVGRGSYAVKYGPPAIYFCLTKPFPGGS